MLNKFSLGEELEVMEPEGDFWIQKITYMEDIKGNSIETANHAEMKVLLKTDKPVSTFAFFRRKR